LAFSGIAFSSRHGVGAGNAFSCADSLSGGGLGAAGLCGGGGQGEALLLRVRG